MYLRGSVNWRNRVESFFKPLKICLAEKWASEKRKRVIAYANKLPKNSIKY
jgi:hypothetical protein